VLPLVYSSLSSLSNWLAPMFGENLALKADVEGILALAARNQMIWDRVEKASFLSRNEKRAAVGYGAAQE
jgi:phage portal protein BeeE